MLRSSPVLVDDAFNASIEISIVKQGTFMNTSVHEVLSPLSLTLCVSLTLSWLSLGLHVHQLL